MKNHRLLLALGIAALALASREAWADPHPLPFSYPYATLPRGLSEIEQYMDMTPVNALVDGQTGERGNTLRGIFVTELEYGLTDRLELGLYMQFSNDITGLSSGQHPLQFDGVKQRLRYRFADPGAWPVNVAIYGEVAELANELELESKIILERRVGRWQFIANMTAEREIYYREPDEWVLMPSGGTSFEITPALHLGVEYWGHAEYPNEDEPRTFNALWHHYVGPAFLFQTSHFWLAAAPYVRLDRLNRAGESRTGVSPDEFGRFWFRTIVGIDL